MTDWKYIYCFSLKRPFWNNIKRINIAYIHKNKDIWRRVLSKKYIYFLIWETYVAKNNDHASGQMKQNLRLKVHSGGKRPNIEIEI